MKLIERIKAYHKSLPIQTRAKFIFILLMIVIRLRISIFLDDCTRLLARFLLWALFGLKYEDYKDYDDYED